MTAFEGEGRDRPLEPRRSAPAVDPRLPMAIPGNLEDDQDRARALISGIMEREFGKLGIKPVPPEEDVVPEPDFRTAGILFGPQFLYDALVRRNQMYDCLDSGDIEGAIDLAVEIVTDFPTEEVRRWLARCKDLREEFRRRCDDLVNYSFEKVLPRAGVSTSWVLSKKWEPYGEEDRAKWHEARRIVIARKFLIDEFGARLIDTIDKISAFMPTDTRILPEDLRYFEEESKLGDDE